MMMGFELILIPLILCAMVAVLAVAGAIAVALGWLPPINLTRPAQTSKTPLEILKARYVSGEITRGEYDEMRLEVEG